MGSSVARAAKGKSNRGPFREDPERVYPPGPAVQYSGILRIIAINLIMAIGGILGTNSDLILLLYHPATYEVADVIGTYTYRLGIVGGEFSYAPDSHDQVDGERHTCMKWYSSNTSEQ